jgi:AcrR family transcriptional regulator
MPHSKTVNPPGTKESEPSDRRAEILEKARGIFMRYGYRKTTLEDIGRSCGMGKAALYYYFSSKEEIFAETVRAECERIGGRIRAAVQAAEGPKAKLTAMVRTRYKYLGDIVGELIGSETASEMKETLPLSFKVRQQFNEEEINLLKQILDEGHRLRVFKKVAPTVPALMMAAIRGVDQYLIETQDTASLQQGVEATLTLFFDGILDK